MKDAILASVIVLSVFIAVGFLIIQIFNNLSIKKQKKYFADLHLALKPGVEVLLASGLYGKLKRVTDEYVIVEIAKGIETKASRYSVKEIVKE